MAYLGKDRAAAVFLFLFWLLQIGLEELNWLNLMWRVNEGYWILKAYCVLLAVKLFDLGVTSNDVTPGPWRQKRTSDQCRTHGLRWNDLSRIPLSSGYTLFVFSVFFQTLLSQQITGWHQYSTLVRQLWTSNHHRYEARLSMVIGTLPSWVPRKRQTDLCQDATEEWNMIHKPGREGFPNISHSIDIDSVQISQTSSES